MTDTQTNKQDFLVRMFPQERTRFVVFAVVALIIIVLALGAFSRFGDTTKLKGGKGKGHKDTPPGTDKMDLMVAEMKKELDKTFWALCYGAESRCVVYRKWLDLLDGEFKAMSAHYEKTHEVSLREDIEKTICHGDCDSSSSRSAMLDRLSRVHA